MILQIVLTLRELMTLTQSLSPATKLIKVVPTIPANYMKILFAMTSREVYPGRGILSLKTSFPED